MNPHLSTDAVILVVLAGAPGFAAPFQIVHPVLNETISGSYKVTVDTSSTAKISAVKYRVGSLLLAVSTTSPFSFSWNTGYVSDGNYSLTATAYDAWGHIVSFNETVVNVKNRDCQVVVNSPNLQRPLTGTVPLSITGHDPRYYPARWNLFVDGNLLGTTWTDNSGRNTISVAPVLDTTRLKNGRHELHIEIGSDYWQPDNRTKVSWRNSRLCLHRIITTNNKHSLAAISANYQHVYLRPGQSTTLNCRSVFSDNQSEPCTEIAYTSSDSSVVAVDAAGRLTAGRTQGFAEIDLKSASKTVTVYVWVKRDMNIPHFSGNGQMRNVYKSANSLFVVAPFVLQPADILEEATNQEVKRAGINTLYSGFYSNPRRISAQYDAWRRGYDSNLGMFWKAAANNGYHLYAMGDEIARNIGGEAWWTMNWPFAKYAVQYAMNSLAGSGVAIAADIIDEGSMMWGATPTPPRKIGAAGMFVRISCHAERCAVVWPNNPVGPKRFFAGTQFALTGSSNSNLNTPPGQMFQATNITANGFQFTPAASVNAEFTPENDPNVEFLWWAGSAGGCPSAPCNPPVPNTALSTVAEWLRSAPSHVPISWPALGIAPPVVQDNWAGKDSKVSDFMSHYWDSFQAGRTYAWSSGIAERSYWMRNAFYSRQPYTNLDRPQIMLDSISSTFYTKRTPGAAFYHPPEDEIFAAGTAGPVAFAGMMTAAALGNAGVRLYQFEEKRNEGTRAKAPVGTELQTGASPFAGDQNSREIWKAMGYAANLMTKRLQPFLLGVAASSPGAGENIIAAVRKSDDGVLLIAINGNDGDRTVSFDLTPYRTRNAIARYLASASGITATLLPNTAQDETVLGPGEAVVYLFSKSRATHYLAKVHVPAPGLPRGASQAVLHHGYIYSEDVPKSLQGIECSKGCNLEIDRTLGDVFGQFLFLNRDGAVVERGPVSKID
jgi:hypothetical protein